MPTEKNRSPAAGHHDLGGNHEFDGEKVCREEEYPDHGAFGGRVDALRLVLGAKKIMSVDELRRGVEAIPKDEYFNTQYYERWLRAITYILIEKGVIEQKDIS